MDNITHWVIGWSIFSYITWKYDNKNFFWWALMANSPDIDVFLAPFITNNSIDKFFFHRSITHSAIYIFAFSLVMTIFSKRAYTDVSRLRLFAAYFVSIFVWHLVIDSFTSYGVRPLLPFDDHAFSTDNIFVVDIFMLLVLIVLFIFRLVNKNKKKLTNIILLFSVWYFVLSFAVKAYITQIFSESTSSLPSDIYISNILTSPEPFQIFLWRWVLSTTNWYYEGYYSIFDKDKNINRKYYPKYINLAMWANWEKVWSYISFWKDSININQTVIQEYVDFTRWYNTFTYLWWDSYRIDALSFSKLNGWIDKFDRSFALNVSTNTQSGYIYNIKQWIGWKDNPISRQDINMFVWRVFGIKK